MAYEKRVCVLKQIKKGFSADGGALTGAVYAERLGGDLTVIPKIAGIAPVTDGRYCLAVWVNGETYCVELEYTIRIPQAPSLQRGFSALLCFVRGEAEPIAYGGCGEAPRDYAVLLSAVNQQRAAAGGKKSKRTAEAPAAEATETACTEGTEDCFRGKYDDEAIAATDYFAVSESDADDGSVAGSEEETQQNGQTACEDDADPPHPAARGTLAYYHEVKAKLDEAFAKFPRDERLKAIFPMSEWVNSEGALLGVIYEEGTPRYLCVAVEAKEEPPAEVKERGVFVPRTQFSDEEGFYVVFQDADTGDYVRVQDA